MIYEAKVLGASAVLLICCYLTERQIRAYLHICDGWAWVRPGGGSITRQKQKLPLQAGARIIGVNNRNLKDFSVDPDNSRQLRTLIPRGAVCFRKRHPQRRRRRSAPGDGSGRSPDRRNSDAGV